MNVAPQGAGNFVTVVQEGVYGKQSKSRETKKKYDASGVCKKRKKSWGLMKNQHRGENAVFRAKS